MRTEDGTIIRIPEGEEHEFVLPGYIKMRLPPTPVQMRRVPPRVGRNEPCPCGSGKKFKRCCLAKKV
jgi:uncharacterized protein YecA (UPF0149 family)